MWVWFEVMWVWVIVDACGVGVDRVVFEVFWDVWDFVFWEGVIVEFG